MSRFRIKRDITSVNPPHPNQLDVGELALNALTGKLYTKLQNGKIVEFTSRQICYEKTPIISFSDVSAFCIHGDILNVKVTDLKDSPQEYIFELEDLTNNNVGFSINDPIYTTYNVYPEPTGTDPNEDLGPPITMREAIVPINIVINGQKPITMLKFKVVTENVEIAERTITISGKSC